jgi:hypothetical protein
MMTSDGIAVPVLLIQEYRQFRTTGGGWGVPVLAETRLQLWDGTKVSEEITLDGRLLRGVSGDGREFRLPVADPIKGVRVPG